MLTASLATEIYTLSLHDALPICREDRRRGRGDGPGVGRRQAPLRQGRQSMAHTRPLATGDGRSEEHTSELQSHSEIVCRLLLEKKNKAEEIQYGCRSNQLMPV